MGINDWRSDARPPTITVELKDLLPEDQVRILEPENSYLRDKIAKQEQVLRLCAEALMVVTKGLSSSNEWPKPGMFFSDGAPIEGGDIYKAVKAATHGLCDLKGIPHERV